MNTWRRRDETVSVRCFILGVSEIELREGRQENVPFGFHFYLMNDALH